MKGNKTFYYSYSPTEKQEIQEIKNKYQPDEDESLAQKIKAIDKRTDSNSAITSVILGIVFTLVFGAGLSLALSYNSYYLGGIVGFIGLMGMTATPFLNEKIKQRNRKKVAKKIVALCDEYLKINK